MTKRDSKYYQWISATLQNDEYSSDQEMISYFMKEGPMSRREAEFYVKQRNQALNEIEFDLKKFKN